MGTKLQPSAFQTDNQGPTQRISNECNYRSYCSLIIGKKSVNPKTIRTDGAEKQPEDSINRKKDSINRNEDRIG